MTSQTRRYFEGWGRRYDSDMQAFGYAEPFHVFEGVKACMNINEDARVRILDIGIGTGLASAPFRDAMPHAHITGMDASPVMLGLCRQKHVADELVQCDASSLPFAEGRFDIVIAAGILEYTSEPEALIAEIWRVLKDGGVAAVTYEPQGTEKMYKKGFLSGVIRNTGHQSTVRCLIPKKIIPAFYHKYLYDPAGIGNIFQKFGLTLESQTGFDAYRWASDLPAIPHILAVARKSA